nr:glycosyltransferase [uncultured Allomuricauda sp.]
MNLKNNTLKKKTILLIGPYSSVGGVSMHIKRLSALLKDFYNFDFIDESPLCDISGNVYNIRSKNLLKYIKLIVQSDIVHIHTGVWWLRCFHIFTAFLLRKKVIVTIHSLSNLSNNILIQFTRLFLILNKKTITVSDEVAKKIKPKAEYIMPAFLPPVMEEEKTLPTEILRILEECKDSKIIVSNAFKLVLHKNEDLYGLDLMIDVARMVKKEKKRYKIIFVVATINDRLRLYDSYMGIIKEEELENVISLIPYSISFVRLMQKSDLVVRATNTDGDALTVREAMFFKIPIIASNVVKRPENVILFKNRDSNDLFSKIIKVLEKGECNDMINNQNDYDISYYQNYYHSIYSS